MGAREFPDARDAVAYLEGRMAERRNLQMRHRFLDDTQLIRNRRDQEVAIPIPPGHDQEMWFEKLESNGIWEKVFKFVTSPSDMTSAYFACDLFKKHLEEKRKMRLLPKVFGVLQNQGILQYTNYSSYVDIEAEAVKSRNKEILNMRLVSKKWKASVEEKFLVSPLGFSQSDWYLQEGSVRILRECCQIQCWFAHVEDVNEAIVALAPGTSQSLVRTIGVEDFCECTDRGILYSKIAQFLDIHGDAVWGLKLIQNRRTPFYYEGLWKLVSRMPNLKALIVHYDCSELDWEENGHENADALLLQFPFPCTPSLEFCLFEMDASWIAPEMVAHILSKNPSLKAVGLDWHHWHGDQDDTIIPNCVWEALRNLRLEQLALKSDATPDVFMHEILQVGEMNWPLKALRLDYGGYNGIVDFGIFFQIINAFSQSIQEVCVALYYGTIEIFGDRTSVVVNDYPNLIKINFPII